MWKPPALDPEKPLYLAIAEALEKDVAAGALKPGQRLPTQREMADLFGVNLSTVSRAMKEGERRGLISGTVGRGTFVSADAGVSAPLVLAEAADAALLEMGLVPPLYALEAETVAAVRAALAAEELGRYLRYAEPAGRPDHRAAGALWVNRFGLRATAADILVTAGSQNGLACSLMALFKSGDRLAVDPLTFPGLKTLAGLLGLRLVPVALDALGMIPEALATACRREPVRGVYLMPEVHNPTTRCLPEDRRDELAAVVARHGLILLEDDAYGYTSAAPQTALSARLPELGIFFGGTSKAFGAGLRISFLAAPKRFRGALEKAILSTVWMASPLNAAIVARIITGGRAEEIIRSKREEARWRTGLALEKLAPVKVHGRPAGFFLWLELPEGWTGREFELAAREAGVRVFCAEKFAVGGGRAPSAVRVSLTGPETRADLARGLDLLADLLAGGYRDPGVIF